MNVSLEIATDVPAGCAGIGGAPGESVWIKCGVTGVEPGPFSDGPYVRMNVDIGRQSAGGEQVTVLGEVTNSRRCEQSREWQTKSMRSPRTLLTTPEDGRVWLLFGSDSGFAPDGNLFHPGIGHSCADVNAAPGPGYHSSRAATARRSSSTCIALMTVPPASAPLSASV